jgi:tetratricopeptide (TPR) repeat protein
VAEPVEPPPAVEPVEPPKAAEPVEPPPAVETVEPPKAAEPVEPPVAAEPVESAPEPAPDEEPEAAAPEVPAELTEKAAEPVEPPSTAVDEPAKPKPPLVAGLRLDLHEATRPVSAPPAKPAPTPTPEPAAEPAAEPVATSTDEVDPPAVEAEPVTEAKSEPATPEPSTAAAEPAEPQAAASDDGDSTETPADADEPDAPSEPKVTDAAPADSAADDAGPAPSPVSPDEPETTEAPAPTDEIEPDGPDEKASADTVLPVPEGTAAGAATALRAATMLHPVVAAPEADDEKPEQPKDPEQVLAAYQWRFHHETLRELVEDPDELRSIRDQLTAKVDVATDNAARARLLSLRAVVSRILGDLGKALSDGKLALAHAEATGELRRIAIAQARLAHVLQWRGDYAEADRLNALANSPELPDRLRATMHEHAGRSCYDQGRYIEACNHFEKALDLRKVDDPELIARTEQALDAVLAKVATNGLGPYPRDEDEILQLHKPPKPSFSEKVQRWGYVDATADWAIAPSYAEVQPFKEGVAWVRRPETEPWELIDESGEVLIFASLGYLGVGSFHDGLAWVSHNGRGNWLAIDKSGDVRINIGFEDVRPFRGGVAAVKRGAWGAIDKNGRTVLPPQYSGFSTALTDGRYVDGFTDEGLAVVDSGGRKGVVDRNGRVLVPPRFPALVIHPVAFLVGGGQGLWGALDRRGEPLIDIVHGSRAAVTEEIDRLLADTKPVL